MPNPIRARGPIDLAKVEAAAGDMLRALGYDLTDESLRDTPRRVSRMYEELLTVKPFESTTFPNDGEYDELVVVRNIPFHALCEHHLLPFIGSIMNSCFCYRKKARNGDLAFMICL